MKSSLWWEGPSFLHLAETEWPHNVVSSNDELTFKELVKNPPPPTHTLMACNSVILDTVFDSNRFSSLTHLLHVTAFVFRFIRNLKESVNGRACDQNSTIYLTSIELREAENYWIHHVQAQSFTAEIQYLRKQSLAATPVYIKQFGLFLDDEFILR